MCFTSNDTLGLSLALGIFRLCPLISSFSEFLSVVHLQLSLDMISDFQPAILIQLEIDKTMHEGPPLQHYLIHPKFCNPRFSLQHTSKIFQRIEIFRLHFQLFF